MTVDTRDKLTLGLALAGLVQFGRFTQPDGTLWPVALHLRWLPSYPALLRDVASALAEYLGHFEADRVLTTRDAIPIGVTLALQAEVPVVYPYGEERDYTSAYVIEGAYDVGHPTLLLADVLLDAEQADAITATGQRVGLDVTGVLAVVDLEHGAHDRLRQSGYQVESVLTLAEMLPVLEDGRWLPGPMRAAVAEWLAE